MTLEGLHADIPEYLSHVHDTSVGKGLAQFEKLKLANSEFEER